MEADPVIQQYGDYRAQLHSSAMEMAKAFDQWILTLSGGAIGISMVLVEKLSAGLRGGPLVLLSISWLLLITSLVTGLCSIHESYRLHLKQMSLLNEEAANGSTLLWTRFGKRCDGLGKAIDVLNWCSLGACIGGILLLAAMALIAISER